jgi:hypothetical protein
MSTLRQKSFLATLDLQGQPLTFGRAYNKPVLKLGKKNKDVAFIFYFRCEGDYYNIYVRTKGDQFGQTLDELDNTYKRSKTGCITTTTAEVPTSFNILSSNGKILTLDNLSSNKEEIGLQTRDGKKLNFHYEVWESEFTTAETSDNARILTLNILERNAPYLGFPDEV